MVYRFLKIFCCYILFSTQLLCQSDLQTYLNTLKTKTGLETALIGISVKQADGTKLASLNEHILLSPASCQKIVTTSTALLLLGADFQFETLLQYDGTLDVSTGVLNGNIYLKGGGDPSFGSDKFTSTVMDSVYSKLVARAKQIGIKKINGRIIGDDTAFETIMAPGTWDWGDLGQYYGAGASGLTVSDNTIFYYLKSGATGTNTQLVRTSPKVPGLVLINEVKSGENKGGDDSFIFGSEYSNYRHLVGKVSANESEFKIKGSIPDPAWFAAYYLDSCLEVNGITVKDLPSTTRILTENKISYTTSADRNHIGTIYSPVLKNLIKQINVQSNNLYAEHLHKYLSYKQNGIGANLTSNEIVQNFWVNKGIPKNELVPIDGSGLSRSNAITASALTDILIKMKSEKCFADFFWTLPVSGKSGTMASFGKGSIIENNYSGKSGSMTRVRAYCGYLKSKNGKDIVFTMIFNNYTCKNPDVKKICEEVAIRIAELN